MTSRLFSWCLFYEKKITIVCIQKEITSISLSTSNFYINRKCKKKNTKKEKWIFMLNIVVQKVI